jgi:cytochrome c1
MGMWRTLAASLVLALLATGCGVGSGGSGGVSSTVSVTPTASIAGDPARGKEVMVKFECARCHSGAIEAPAKEKQCTGCHSDIMAGTVQATPAKLAHWQANVVFLADTPTLVYPEKRFRRSWIANFLLHPHDLRPSLAPSMPRLPLTEQQAADVAAYLSPLSDPKPAEEAAALEGTNVAMGRELLDVKGCVLCHRMTGVPPMRGTMLPVGINPREMSRAMRLAPDLRFTRDRYSAATLVAWLLDPASIKPDTLMPRMGLTEPEAKNIAAYILRTPLAPAEPKVIPLRLPVLDRKVTYDEVATRVLRKTCWHCHGEPDFERGDGGPGNSGGFGFRARGLDLSDYAATFAGMLDDTGRRVSVFAPLKGALDVVGVKGNAAAPTEDRTPVLVAAMLARQREEAGEETAIRGMPLGLPALPPEDIQLVETWIAQGRPR